MKNEEAVLERLGNVVLLPVEHWISGRSRSVAIVERREPGQRTVFKWMSESELRVLRDDLSESIIPAPKLLRWWPAAPGLDAAVEIEYVPRLAVLGPEYHFAAEFTSFTDGDWLGGDLNRLVDLLADIHRTYRGAMTHLDATGPESDLSDFDKSLGKLDMIAAMPGGNRWRAFWMARRSAAIAAFASAHAFPCTWIWEDAKWDHVGQRADGSPALLEWGHRRGPGGSDLFILLFLDPQRRDELVQRYVGRTGAADHEVWAALLRSCYVHGPGLSVLSVRGVAEGGSTPDDLAAWSREAEIVAYAIQEIAAHQTG